MKNLPKYTKRGSVRDLRRFPSWTDEVKIENLQPEAIVNGKIIARVGVRPEDALYLQEDLTVTETLDPGNNIIFDKVTDLWARFCREHLGFEIPA